MTNADTIFPSVGRYKYNKKLAIGARLYGQILADTVVNALTGEVMAEAGQKCYPRNRQWRSRKPAYRPLRSTVDEGERTVKVISNGMVDIKNFVDFDTEECMASMKRSASCVLTEILGRGFDCGRDARRWSRTGINELIPKHIIIDDIFAIDQLYQLTLPMALALWTISTTLETAGSVLSGNCCRTSSVLVFPEWSVLFVRG